MTATEVYWPYVAMATASLVALPLLYFAVQRRWTWIALIVALANLLIVFLNGAAPIRGALDPNYIGYGFGFVSADKGLAVTSIAGAIVLASALSAWIAIRNRAGLAMLVVAATAAFHIVNIGFPLLDGILAKPEDVVVQLGEYFTIPHTIAIPALVSIVLLPFLLALPWAIQRTFETE
jgi:hypothetical protein